MKAAMNLRIRRGCWSWPGLVLVLCCARCTSHRLALLPSDFRQDQKDHFIRLMDVRYPERFTVVQRIVLQIGKRQHDFIGYLSMHRGHAFRATAVGEMGGMLFDLLYVEGKAYILRKPDKMPAAPLLRGVIRDIQHLYFFAPDSAFHVTRDEVDNISFHYTSSLETFQTYEFADDLANLLIRSREVKNGRLIRQVEYLPLSSAADSTRIWPPGEKILLRNHRYHYQLEIERLKFEPAVLSDEAFQPLNP